MNVLTYGEALDRINSDLDLDNETFIQDDEMVGYFNEALDDANAEIQKLNEDYMLKSCIGTLTAGQSQLVFSGTDLYGNAFAAASMPVDIYANKIRDLVYVNATTIYKIRRVRGMRPFLDRAFSDSQANTAPYRYMMTSPTIQTSRIDLTPVARETGGLVQCWYLRHLSKIPLPSAGSLEASRAALLDLPEFANFLLWYVKCMCLPKEGDPRLADATTALNFHRNQMIITLKEKVPDEDDEMIEDLSHYQEHQ